MIDISVLYSGLETPSTPHRYGRKITQIDPPEHQRMAVAKSAAEALPSARIEFTGGSVSAVLDVSEFKKVAVNLYLNAMEAGGNAPFKVFVGDEGGPVMRVSDSGAGIDEEILEGGLFVPFKTTKKKGMGIGLYQSKQILEAHGGSIVATSPEGGGAIFTVTLPAPADAE